MSRWLWMRFAGYTPDYCSADAALVSVPTNKSKTGEGLVKMRSLWGENTDDSETGSGLNSFEKETQGLTEVTVQTNNAADLYAKGDSPDSTKLRLTKAAASIRPRSHVRLQHTWKCVFVFFVHFPQRYRLPGWTETRVLTCDYAHRVRGLRAVNKTVHLN